MALPKLVAWALALMIAKSNPAKIAALPTFPGWAETAEHRLERYEGIATAAVVVGRDQATIAKLLAISFHESGWMPDVDVGPCYRGRDGKGPRCASGRAACMMQIRVDVHKSHSARELFASRELCFSEGLRILQLGGYTSYAGDVKIGEDLRSMADRFASFVPAPVVSDVASSGSAFATNATRAR